ncbi:MAG TPA: hypothetical protein VEH28_05215 [Thermoplasmata archaeon]|nr:hypothetical protein [Thermoplasmata archaeon]
MTEGTAANDPKERDTVESPRAMRGNKAAISRSYTAGVLAVFVVIATVAGLAVGHYVAPTSQTTNSTKTTTTPYLLSLEEVMDVNWNSSVGAQPVFYVVTPSGLSSSATITIPSHTLIELQITSYDMGSSPPPPQFDNVTGVLGDRMMVINGTAGSGTNVSQMWETNYTSVPAAMIIHTFTVPQLNLNIPVIGQDTMISYFYANTTGTFRWLCETPCGAGPGAMGGAMTQRGWMTGSLTVTG